MQTIATRIGSKMELAVDGPMLRAWKEGVEQYRPTFQDEPLEIESGDVDVTLRNLQKIIHGLQREGWVSHFYVGAKAQILVTFTSGENYLATGFTIGEETPKVRGLAQFAAENGLGRFNEVYPFLAALPKDYRGVILFDETLLD